MPLFAKTHFWIGNFGFAFVDIKDGYGENMNSFVILILPYILDLISIIIGYYFYHSDFVLASRILSSFTIFAFLIISIIIGIMFILLLLKKYKQYPLNPIS